MELSENLSELSRLSWSSSCNPVHLYPLEFPLPTRGRHSRFQLRDIWVLCSSSPSPELYLCPEGFSSSHSHPCFSHNTHSGIIPCLRLFCPSLLFPKGIVPPDLFTPWSFYVTVSSGCLLPILSSHQTEYSIQKRGRRTC